MIVRMIRVRIAGPRSLLERTLAVVQDLGVLHVDRPSVPDGREPDTAVMREQRHVERCLIDVETALDRLHQPVDATVSADPAYSPPQAARRADARDDAPTRWPWPPRPSRMNAACCSAIRSSSRHSKHWSVTS